VLVAWILTRRALPGPDAVRCVRASALVVATGGRGLRAAGAVGAHGPIGAWLRSHFGIELAFHDRGAALATAVMNLFR